MNVKYIQGREVTVNVDMGLVVDVGTRDIDGPQLQRQGQVRRESSDAAQLEGTEEREP